MPELDFRVAGVETVKYAAGPTLVFRLKIENRPADEQIKAVMLRIQIRIEALQRRYSDEEKLRLHDLFGEADRWGQTVRSLLWTHAVVSVPPFAGECTVEAPIVCTYDFDVVGAKYLYALENGDVPLLFLFSGTVLYENDMGVQVSQISWEKEAAFRLPIRIWKETMDHYFPNCAWMRINKEVFDRLYEFKLTNALIGWDDTLNRLLDSASDREMQPCKLQT
jgi:hypothetical protein